MADDSNTPQPQLEGTPLLLAMLGHNSAAYQVRARLKLESPRRATGLTSHSAALKSTPQSPRVKEAGDAL